MSEARPQLDDEDLRQVRQIFEWCRTGAAEPLRSALRQGLPPNLMNEKGDSLLMLAAYHGHHEAARALLEAGAEPDKANDRGQTPLAGAAFKGDLAMAKLLIEQGASAVAPLGDGKTAFMMAAMFNRLDIMELLVEHGADPDARDYRGIGAVDVAQQTGAGDAVEWLRARAANAAG
jgi:ankyrin repeat protein